MSCKLGADLCNIDWSIINSSLWKVNLLSLGRLTSLSGLWKLQHPDCKYLFLLVHLVNILPLCRCNYIQHCHAANTCDKHNLSAYCTPVCQAQNSDTPDFPALKVYKVSLDCAGQVKDGEWAWVEIVCQGLCLTVNFQGMYVMCLQGKQWRIPCLTCHLANSLRRCQDRHLQCHLQHLVLQHLLAWETHSAHLSTSLLHPIWSQLGVRLSQQLHTTCDIVID